MRPVKRAMPYRFSGGIYAAPTHRPCAVTMQKRYRGASLPPLPVSEVIDGYAKDLDINGDKVTLSVKKIG